MCLLVLVCVGVCCLRFAVCWLFVPCGCVLLLFAERCQMLCAVYGWRMLMVVVIAIAVVCCLCVKCCLSL